MRSRQGYSFPEVLFAVVVLGIGFIMIAAIFPVAISQSKLTMDENTSTAVSRGGVNVFSQMAYDPRTTLPAPLSYGIMLPTYVALVPNPQPPFIGQVYPIDSRYGWETVKNNLIFSDDHRFAYIPLYRRDGNRTATTGSGSNVVLDTSSWSGSCQLYVLVVQCRGNNRPFTAQVPISTSGPTAANVDIPLRTGGIFDQYDFNLGYKTLSMGKDMPDIITENQNNLFPRQINVKKLTNDFNGAGADILEIDPNVKDNVPWNDSNMPDGIAEGTFIVMRETGRIYRIGTRRGDLDGAENNNICWELMPGGDISLVKDPANPSRAKAEDISSDTKALYIGRERLPQSNNATGGVQFIGGAQDVGIYTTFIPCKP